MTSLNKWIAMETIGQLQEYLQKQDVYDLDDVNGKFKEIADFLMNKCVVKVGTRKFRMYWERRVR